VARKRQPAENAAAVRVVEIAIERLSGRKAGRCTWLRNKQAKFKQRSCRKPIWLKATGTRHWTVTYSRLPPGRYEVFALAISNNGLSADTFAPRAGDTKIFRVR
jgi:hypothetical protein